MRCSAIAALLSAAVLAVLVSPASAIETGNVHVDRDVYHHSPLVVDVWTNRGEGAVYYPGERIMVYFRASRDCYVTLYNIDAEGYVHLLYPARAFDSHFIMGGVTYRIPSRRDPYYLTVSGPHGIEYIEAVASVEPFHDRTPWYLDPEYGDWRDWEDPWTLFGDEYEYYDEDYDYFVDRGVVRGDPFLGIQRINSRMIPYDYPSDYYATAYTSFYVGRRVSYPRYLCYDCHWRHPRFDPYSMGCIVFDIRIDRTWVYSPRIVHRDYRPRYYYRIKDAAPVKYKGSRHFWSSKDGLSTLKKEFAPVKYKGGPPLFNVPDAEKQKLMKDWGPSGLKTWKPGKSPPVGKVESLRKKLESDGVVKSKQYRDVPQRKTEPATPKKKVEPKKEVKPKKEAEPQKKVRPKQPATPKKEVKPSKQKQKKTDSSLKGTEPQPGRATALKAAAVRDAKPEPEPREPEKRKVVEKAKTLKKQSSEKSESVKAESKTKQVKEKGKEKPNGQSKEKNSKG
jgi:hypothetical protein